MKKTIVLHPVLLGAFYYVLLWFDFSGVLRIGLLAAFLHEIGHVLIWGLMVRQLPVIKVQFLGLELCRSGKVLSSNQELLLAMAGPTANLLAAGCAGILMQRNASYYGYQFASANLLMALFNLIPFSGLDGRYLWKFICEKLQSRAG